MLSDTEERQCQYARCFAEPRLVNSQRRGIRKWGMGKGYQARKIRMFDGGGILTDTIDLQLELTTVS